MIRRGIFTPAFRLGVRDLPIIGSGAVADDLQGLTVADDGSTTATLDWFAATNADNYKVERRTSDVGSGAGSWSTLDSAVVGLTYVDSSRSAATEYDYRVTPQGAGGDGAAQTYVVTIYFSGSGTPTISAFSDGVFRVWGGGGGGSDGISAGAGGAGGGSGGYRAIENASFAGGAISYTVGDGGAAGTDGSASSIAIGSYSATADPGTLGILGVPGSGGAGDINGVDGSAPSGDDGGAGGNAAVAWASIGTGTGGAGGTGGGAGSAGTQPGAGGGGGSGTAGIGGGAAAAGGAFRFTGVYPPTIPEDLTGLVATPGTNIDLDWDASIGAKTYRIERRTAGGVSWDVLEEDYATLSYTDSGPATGIYDYRVTPKNGLGALGTAGVATNVPTNTPAALSSLAVTFDADSGDLVWGASDLAVSYTVERRTSDTGSGAGSYSTLASGVTATSYSDGTISGSTSAYDTAYDYRVTPVNSLGSGTAQETIYRRFESSASPSLDPFANGEIELWGAGGGGGDGAGTNEAGGGGGGGGWSWHTNLSGSSGTYTFTVGTGGAPNTGGGASSVGISGTSNGEGGSAGGTGSGGGGGSGGAGGAGNNDAGDSGSSGSGATGGAGGNAGGTGGTGGAAETNGTAPGGGGGGGNDNGGTPGSGADGLIKFRRTTPA